MAAGALLLASCGDDATGRAAPIAGPDTDTPVIVLAGGDEMHGVDHSAATDALDGEQAATDHAAMTAEEMAGHGDDMTEHDDDMTAHDDEMTAHDDDMTEHDEDMTAHDEMTEHGDETAHEAAEEMAGHGDETTGEVSDHEDEAAEPPSTDGVVVEVEMVEFGYVMDTATVPMGEPVTFRFVNDGAVPHEAMFGDAHQQDEFAAQGGHGDDHGDAGHHGDVAAITLGPGETGEIVLEFTTPGEIWIGCHLPGHWDAGMVATFDVA